MVHTHNKHLKNQNKHLARIMRKYPKCNIIESILPKRDKIIAIGDIHGDFSVLLESLRISKMIDCQNNWCGGDTIVVQVGDIFDGGGRGLSRATGYTDELEIMEFLYDLHQQALVYGGKVISLIGNHELMNILGDFRYASQEQIEGMGGYCQRKAILKPGGALATKIACNSLGIVKIGDWVFVHGGLLPEHFDLSKKKKTKHIIYEINHLVRGIILGTIRLQDITPREEAMIFGGDGVFWTRKLSGNGGENGERCRLVNDTLQLLNIDKGKGGIVMGHTPQPYINSLCNQQIWRIDTGMSRAFGDKIDNKERVQTLTILNNGEQFEIN